MPPRLLAAALAIAGCIPYPEPIVPGPVPPPEPRAQGPNPLAGMRFYVDPSGSARRQVDAWRASRPDDAAALERIAGQPHADWFGDWNPDVAAAVDQRVSQIGDAGAVPLLVLYDIPFRDCGHYSAGGARDTTG